MITSKDLAKAIYQISKESKKDSNIIVSGLINYVRTYKLESLLPRTLIYLEEMNNKNLIWNTFFIESKFELNEDLIKKIKTKLNIPNVLNLEIKKNDNIVGGFIATYKGIIYDASIKNQLQLLRNLLMK